MYIYITGPQDRFLNKPGNLGHQKTALKISNSVAASLVTETGILNSISILYTWSDTDKLGADSAVCMT